MGHVRYRGDLVATVAATRRIPDDPGTLSALGLAGWDVIPLLVLANAGTAELWTGDVSEAEKHLRTAVDTNQWSGLLRPHLNAASQLALLLAERGDLDAAHGQAQAAVQRATQAGWAVSVQAVSPTSHSPGCRWTGASPRASTAGSDGLPRSRPSRPNRTSNSPPPR
jgi:hypothetical protein